MNIDKIAIQIQELVFSLIRSRKKTGLDNRQLKTMIYEGIINSVSEHNIDDTGQKSRVHIYPESDFTILHPLEEFFKHPKTRKKLKKNSIFRSQVYCSLSNTLWVRKSSMSNLQTDIFLDKYSATPSRVDWLINRLTDCGRGSTMNSTMSDPGDVSPDIENMLARIGWEVAGSSDNTMLKNPDSYVHKKRRTRSSKTDVRKGGSRKGSVKRKIKKGEAPGHQKNNLLDFD